MIHLRWIIPVWLSSLALAFHFGWWGRHRLTQKIKANMLKQIDEALKLNVTPGMLKKIKQAYWDML